MPFYYNITANYMRRDGIIFAITDKLPVSLVVSNSPCRRSIMYKVSIEILRKIKFMNIATITFIPNPVDA